MEALAVFLEAFALFAAAAFGVTQLVWINSGVAVHIVRHALALLALGEILDLILVGLLIYIWVA